MAHAILIDRIRCDGHGLCAELLPEVIELDEWGYPLLQPGPVPCDLREYSKRAVAACPVQALRLQALPRTTPRGGPA